MNTPRIILTALIIAIVLLMLGEVISQLITIKGQLTTLQFSIDNYADERSSHYRTIEYYLHNTAD